MSATYYEILGVSREASQGDIGKAYHQIMKRHHPDVHGNQQDPISRLVNIAHDVLNNPKTRRKYDQTLNESKGDGNRTPGRSSNDNGRSSFEERVQRTIVDCPRCKGHGWIGLLGLNRCQKCGGRGKLVQFIIPPGRKLCSNCNGHGETRPEFDFMGILPLEKCNTCKGRGLEPVKKSVRKVRCKECRGSGFNQTFGVSHNCRYCDGEGWVPGPRTEF